MDKRLLQDLFNIPARSHQEGLVRVFVKSKLKEMKVPFEEDGIGNIFRISKHTPLLSAHMDTVQDETDAKLAIFSKIRGNFIAGYGVIGGDDKCGVYLILDLLKERNDYNFVFSVGEEVGGVGIRSFVSKNDLSHIPYGLVLDRRGGNDIVCDNNDYGTKEFEEALAKVGKLFGYKPAMGTFSDGDFLNEQLSVANISVGYHNPHMKSEFVDLAELENAKRFIWYFTKNVSEKFEKPVKTAKKYGSYFHGDDGKTCISVYDEDFACVGCNEENSGFLFIESLNRFVCLDCYRKLRKEVLEKDENEELDFYEKEVTDKEIQELIEADFSELEVI